MRTIIPVRALRAVPAALGILLALCPPSWAGQGEDSRSKSEVSTVGHEPQRLTAAEILKVREARRAGGFAVAPSAALPDFSVPAKPSLPAVRALAPLPPPSAVLQKAQAAKLDAFLHGRLMSPLSGRSKPVAAPAPAAAAVPAPSPGATPSAPRKEAPR